MDPSALQRKLASLERELADAREEIERLRDRSLDLSAEPELAPTVSQGELIAQAQRAHPGEIDPVGSELASVSERLAHSERARYAAEVKASRIEREYKERARSWAAERRRLSEELEAVRSEADRLRSIAAKELKAKWRLGQPEETPAPSAPSVSVPIHVVEEDEIEPVAPPRRPEPSKALTDQFELPPPGSEWGDEPAWEDISSASEFRQHLESGHGLVPSRKLSEAKPSDPSMRYATNCLKTGAGVADLRRRAGSDNAYADLVEILYLMFKEGLVMFSA